MFRISWFNHQEDSLYTQFLYGMFFMHLRKHVKHTRQKVSVQTVFLMINPRGTKHVEDVKIELNNNLRSAHFFGLCCIILSQFTVLKNLGKQ